MSLKRKFQNSRVLIFKVLKTVYINQPLKRKTFRGDLSHSSAHDSISNTSTINLILFIERGKTNFHPGVLKTVQD